MADPKEIPVGELVIKTIAMPANTNRYGDIFGGWLVAQMDLGGAILAHKAASNRMTTVAIDNMAFLKPVYVGDTVSCFATVAKKGRTSVGISVEAWVERLEEDAMYQVTKGIFTFVAIDPQGKPTPFKW